MFDEGKSKKIGRKGEEAPHPPRSAPFNWKSLPMEDLIRFRDEITTCLPALTLIDIDMEQELLLQYHSMRALQNEVLADTEVPRNQQAQIANACSAVLAKIAELQETLYDSERLKRIEKVLIASLDELPTEVKEKFLTEYEKALENV